MMRTSIRRCLVPLCALLVLATGVSVSAQLTYTQYAVAAGIVQLDGANPTSVALGLNAVRSCTVQLMAPGTSATDFGPTGGGEPITLTIQTHATRGQLDIYAWVNADPPTQSTSNAYRVAYFCLGDI